MNGEIIELNEEKKIRSRLFFFDANSQRLLFDAGRLECYSFEIINTGDSTVIINGSVVLAAVAPNNASTSIRFPRVAGYKRTDVITLEFGAVGTPSAYIRADLEIR